MNPQDPSPSRSSRSLRLSTALLLIAVPTAFMVFFTALQLRFDYPDILRRPAAEVLTRFAHHQAGLLPLWYGMFASALLFIPLSIAVAALHHGSRSINLCLTTCGVLAGLVQSIGLSRWIFVVPMLASRLSSTPAAHEQAAIATTFDTLNALLGVAIGEHMGYLFTVAWTLLLAWAIRTPRPLTAALGALSAAGIAAGLLEPVGLPAAAMLNALGYSLWSLWLIWLGVLLILNKRVF